MRLEWFCRTHIVFKNEGNLQRLSERHLVKISSINNDKENNSVKNLTLVMLLYNVTNYDIFDNTTSKIFARKYTDYI